MEHSTRRIEATINHIACISSGNILNQYEAGPYILNNIQLILFWPYDAVLTCFVCIIAFLHYYTPIRIDKTETEIFY